MTATLTKYDAAANMAMFLLEHTGSVCGVFRGTLRAAEQRALFGRFLGKGTVSIDGECERLAHSVTRCFGLDYEVTFERAWGDL